MNIKEIRSRTNFVQSSHFRTNVGRAHEAICSDKGGEYTEKNVTCFLQSEGIQIQLTGPYGLQQNGMAERKNSSLIEMT